MLYTFVNCVQYLSFFANVYNIYLFCVNVSLYCKYTVNINLKKKKTKNKKILAYLKIIEQIKNTIHEPIGSFYIINRKRNKNKNKIQIDYRTLTNRYKGSVWIELILLKLKTEN